MATTEKTDINYQYFVEYIKQIPNHQSLKILDFGCGQGEIVKFLRKEGVDCYGTDIFYEGASSNLAENELFREGIIKAISKTGQIPFEEKSFDVIISNQVFEHIKDIYQVFESLKALLKDEGIMYHHFPSKEVMYKGHIGLYFVHWMPRGLVRYYYTMGLRSLGFGYFKNNQSFSEWAKTKLEWMDTYCFYRKYVELYGLFEKNYIISHQEIEYCRFRGNKNMILRFLFKIELLKEFYQLLFRRLAFMAIKLTPRAPVVKEGSHE